jgi:hypothetical protein
MTFMTLQLEPPPLIQDKSCSSTGSLLLVLVLVLLVLLLLLLLHIRRATSQAAAYAPKPDDSTRGSSEVRSSCVITSMA